MMDRAAVDFTDCITEVKNLIIFPYLQMVAQDKAVTEEEVLYLLFLNEGKPEIKFFSDDTPSHTTTEELKEAISSAFKRTGMTEFHTKLTGFNVDGASVNTGIHKA